MFEAKASASVASEVIDVLSPLVTEARFKISEEGIKVRAVDPAHVAMADLVLKPSAFKEYKATEKELGIDLEKLKEVMKLARGDEDILLRFDEESNKFVVQIHNITRKMPIVDVSGMSEPKIPNLNLQTEIAIKTTELEQGIRASESVSDHVTFIATPEGFELKSKGDLDSVELKLPKKLLSMLRCKEETKSTFSLDYFSNMIKPIRKSKETNMKLGTDFPVQLEFDIANKNGHVIYLLAPRIESE